MDSSENNIRILIETEEMPQTKSKVKKNKNIIFAVVGSLLLFIVLMGIGKCAGRLRRLDMFNIFYKFNA